jgi:hypothetical protein
MSGQVFQYITLAEKFRVRNEIVDSLKDIGVPRQDIIKAQTVWIIALCDGFLRIIKGEAKKLLPNVDVERELNELPKDDARQSLPVPNELRAWVASKTLSDPEINQLLDEYQSVWNTGTMIDPNAKFP